MTTDILIKKKSGILQDYNREKIFVAIRKSAVRAGVTLTEQQELDVVLHVENNIFNRTDNVIPVEQMHELVIAALSQYAPEVGISYREYHDWAKKEAERIAQNESECQSIQYGLKKDNANMDTALVSTKRAKKMEVHEKSAFQKYNLTRDQLQAVEDGYIYVHDQAFRRDTMNCFHRNTRFLTNKGIHSFNDFYNGEKIVVLTHKGNWKDAVVRSYGRQEVQIIKFKRTDGLSKEIVCTPNHRWILEDESETTDLSIGDVLFSAPDVAFSGKDQNGAYKNFAWTVEDIYKDLGEEQVWCLEVEDDHSFILEDGIVTGNCCLFDVAKVLKGGFEMGNIWYSEPKTLDTAFDVVGDIVLSAASQQYGGFTLCQVDEILAPYAEKSYQKYLKKYLLLASNSEKAEEMARQDTLTEMRQGFQGWEYKFNTVGSSRGDYPFITTTLGKGTQKWAPELSIAALETRMGGQGKEGFKKPVLFPKIVFLYDENLHGPGKELEDVFEAGVKCSAKTMYPDWLSLTGKGYIASMYKRYGKVISPMGCRAFLSPWYEKGGMHPADENDEPVFIGRFNVGAVSLNLPMILAKSKRECKDFYEVLDYYLEIIRSIHLQTYAYLGRMKASSNPLAYCEGGFYRGNLQQEDNIETCLEAATASFGITAFNELQRLYNGKSLAEEAKAYIERTGLTDSTEVKESFNDESLFDLLGYTYDKDQYGFTSNVRSGFFALDVLQYINMKVEQFKKEDGKLYAIYGTPAESLCFEGNTPVLTNDGYKPIKDVKVGDMVYSYNESTHVAELNKVVAARCTQKNAHVIKVRLSNGAEFICTPNHPFAVIGENAEVEWKQAGDLKVGSDCVLVMKHDFSSYWAKVVAKECEEPTDVYNIEVESNHNYFVGKEDSVLVHNCGLQIKQFRKEFGIIEGVSDREYVSNSFHCHVTEDITPIQKQDYEGLFWEMSNGGKIQYVRYPINYNYRALKTLIRRAMDKGFYEGVNLSLAYCDDCGHEELEMDVCPKCGSKNLTKIDRMNGYLAYSRVHGDTRLNAAKMAEIAERKSM